MRRRQFLVYLSAAGLCGAAPFAAPVFAQDSGSSREDVLACVATMEAATTWDQCRTMLFAGCALHPVGSPSHLACLREDRDGWQDVMTSRREALVPVLAPQATVELTTLMGQWFGFVSNKCAAVGIERAQISEAAAVLGCELSETVGLTAELEACADGRSTASYCILAQE